eukprot:7972900-Alexandrium_andersonii.AAC.1
MAEEPTTCGGDDQDRASGVPRSSPSDSWLLRGCPRAAGRNHPGGVLEWHHPDSEDEGGALQGKPGLQRLLRPEPGRCVDEARGACEVHLPLASGSEARGAGLLWLQALPEERRVPQAAPGQRGLAI